SYCITRFARGRITSYPISEIIQDVCFAVNQGCKEIQITAQDTASYGIDIGSNLGELLLNICRIGNSFRIRVGMMNPSSALRNLKNIIPSYDDSKVYKFLHLPVQSGDNEILKKMNRNYTVNDFLKIVKRFRDKYPEITLSTDIIVGFPTETNEHFEHTVNLLKKIKPDIVNITRYSARPFTKAKNMRGRLPTEIVKKRSKLLTGICNELSKEKNKDYVGKKYTILVTEKGKNETFVGRSENYKPIVVNEKVNLGSFVDVEIIKASSTYLVGKLI
ncbi:MAG: hypothetical protein DRO67_06985, partial [Candidatus Asgardarchaeum californiense]